MSALGVKLNNPCNVRYNPKNRWRGLVGHQKGFCQFDTLDNGYRAALKLLYNYVGILGPDNYTIYNILNRFAPPSENNLDNYVHFVSDGMGISSTHIIDSSNDYLMYQLLRYITLFETLQNVNYTRFFTILSTL